VAILYEATVIARVLRTRSVVTAQRFLDQQWVELAIAIKDGRVHVGETAEDRRSLALIHGLAEECIDRHGPELRYQYGWAAATLKKRKPTFEDLERLGRSRRRRPIYRGASHQVHLTPLVAVMSLTHPAAGATNFIGPRHDGIHRVGHLTATALAELNADLLMAANDPVHRRERYVWMAVANHLADEAAIDLDRAEVERIADWSSEQEIEKWWIRRPSAGLFPSL
jgi:hypothetical protein